MLVRGAVLAVAIATMASAGGFGQTPAKRKAVKPDFSHVRSRADAQALVEQGKLVRVLAFPAELGGPDVPENIVYITPEAAHARELVVGTLKRFTRAGTIDKLTVKPEYKGDSFVPSRLVMNATSSEGSGSFNPTIEIW